jgi:lysophospholipase L1-like esterase
MLQGVAGAVALGAVAGPGPAFAGDDERRELVRGGAILFQGDSITDWGRDRDAEAKPNDAAALGSGYARLLAQQLLRDYPMRELRIWNRGISGNKVPDLAARWDEDCLALEPDVLSILIGVNDIWHKIDGHYDASVADYREGYAALLRRTRDALPELRLIVCEPFVLRCGAVDDRWFPEFDERRAAAKAVAEEAGADWVPLQAVFDRAVAAGSKPEYWAADGVHPTMAGQSLLAKAWRKYAGL